MQQRFLESLRAREHLRARTGREDGGRWLRRRPAPLARFRLQPGVRRVSRLHTGRRSPPRRLERLCAHRAPVSEAFSRRDQQPADHPAGRQQLHAVRLASRQQDGLRALPGRLALLSGDSRTARCRRPHHLRRRDPQLRPPLHAAGPVASPAGRARTGRSARPHRFRQAHALLPGVPEAPRHGADRLRLLGIARKHRPQH